MSEALPDPEQIARERLLAVAADYASSPAVFLPELETIFRPPHYHFSAVEPITAIEAWNLNFNLGNTVKYIARAEHKKNPLEDLKKARWYLDREITNREAAKP